MGEILCRREDGVATITISDPPTLNSLSDAMQFELMRLVNETAADQAVRAVVLTGAGQAFSSGGNVKKMEGKRAQSAGERAELMRQKHQLAVRIRHSPKVFVALIPGACYGAGLGLALACDFRIAAQSARFGTAFARIGLSGDFGISWNLTHLVGSARARELLMLADSFDAASADAWGLVNRVVLDAALAEEGQAFAQRIAAGPAVALGLIKRNLEAALRLSLSEMIDLEITHQMQAIGTEDHLEAVRAFADKRKPVFQGR